MMANENRLDLIDRGKVLNEAFMVSMDGRIGYVVDREVICRLPTVDAVEVVHGQWIRKKLVMCEPYYLCSVCGKLHDQDYNFCNNCGAKMDGDGNG